MQTDRLARWPPESTWCFLNIPNTAYIHGCTRKSTWCGIKPILCHFKIQQSMFEKPDICEHRYGVCLIWMRPTPPRDRLEYRGAASKVTRGPYLCILAAMDLMTDSPSVRILTLKCSSASTNCFNVATNIIMQFLEAWQRRVRHLTDPSRTHFFLRLAFITLHTR